MAKPAFATVLSAKKLILSAAAFLTLAALMLGVYFMGAYAVFYGGTTRRIPIYSVEREDKYISITFDCAWGTEHTDGILSALSEYGVKATFFMVEFWTEKYADYVSRIHSEGHSIGTHSKTHSYMSKLSALEIRSELLSSAAAITQITGEKVELFRAPYGDYDNELIDSAEEEGFYTIQWDVDSLDWKDLSAGEISMRVINRVKSGSIILMHNNGLHTAEAVPVILKELISRGYTFVPVEQLIYKENYYIDSNGRQQPAA